MKKPSEKAELDLTVVYCPASGYSIYLEDVRITPRETKPVVGRTVYAIKFPVQTLLDIAKERAHG